MLALFFKLGISIKKLLVPLALLASQAFGSHFQICEVDAHILEVNDVARLDGVAIFMNPHFMHGKSDFDQVMKLQVNNVGKVEGHGGCISKGSTPLLSVKKEQVGTYKKGQALKLQYKNVGDVSGSRISWEIIK